MIALVNGRVLDTTQAPAFSEPQTVLIGDDGAIVSVESAQPPADAEQIDCTGRFVVPGLIDMHNHLKRADLEQLPAWGVTTARDVGNPLTHVLGLRADVQAGSLAGPRIFASGPLIDGAAPMWPDMTVSVDTPADAEAAIEGLHEAGIDGIKMYMGASPDLVAAVVQAAHRRGMPVTAHLGATTCLEAATAGVNTLEHACQGLYDGVVADEDRLAWNLRWTLGQSTFWAQYYGGWSRVDPDGTKVGDCLQRLIDADVSLDPTLMVEQRVIDWIHDREGLLATMPGVPQEISADWISQADWFSKDWTPRDVVVAQEAMDIVAACVRRYVSMGGHMVVGTDQPFCFLQPGKSMHEEMAALQRYGIPAADVLLGATSRAAAALGWQHLVGTVAPGLRADLIVVDADPLLDVAHLRKVHTIVADGRPVEPAATLRPAG